ncbi:MAG: single-stranded DNA-binding protein [Bacteroidales bacterium]|nr:single-stranded DNA-binding protein [Bacteroidales bacterium]
MASLNKVMLIGNVGRDPEVRDFEGGARRASFTLATTEQFRDREQTEWHNIIAWRQLAELSEKYIRKGSQIYVEGRITTRSWDGNDGVKHYTTEIVANTIQLLGRRADGQGGDPGPQPEPRYSRPAAPAAPAAAPAPTTAAPAESVESTEVDDLPF